LHRALQTATWWELSHQLHSPLTDQDRRLLQKNLNGNNGVMSRARSDASLVSALTEKSLYSPTPVTNSSAPQTRR
jgi:hypothetical protein